MPCHVLKVKVILKAFLKLPSLESPFAKSLPRTGDILRTSLTKTKLRVRKAVPKIRNWILFLLSPPEAFVSWAAAETTMITSALPRGSEIGTIHYSATVGLYL